MIFPQKFVKHEFLFESEVGFNTYLQMGLLWHWLLFEHAISQARAKGGRCTKSKPEVVKELEIWT